MNTNSVKSIKTYTYRRVAGTVTLLVVSLLFFSTPVFANQLDGMDGSGKSSSGTTTYGCANVGTSIINCDSTGGNPILSLIMQITNFLAVGVGIAVVGGIAWGALLHATSNGDAAKTKQAITIIVNAVIGLLLFIFAWALINFLVPGGII